MYTFTATILKILNSYKTILKKHLSHSEWEAKIDALGLKRKALKKDDEVALYHKAQTVLADILPWVNQDPNSPSCYSGLDEFCQYLKSLLEEYQVENNKVIHTSQKASRAIVEAVQLIKLSTEQRSNIMATKLDHCGKTIARYGSREHHELFAKALKTHQQHDVNFFLPLLHNFEKYLHEFTDFLVGRQFEQEAQ